MPAGLKGTYVADNNIIEFPVGTALIKTFYYDHVQPDNVTKIIETRVMIRKSNEWIFAEYVWNEDQTEATLSMNGSFVSLDWDEEGTPKSTIYRIPSETECLICHKSNNLPIPCLLYTSDAADERSSVDLGGRRIIKKTTTVIKVMRC